MKIKIKKLHPGAIKPKYAKLGDAGMDFTATSITYDTNYITYHTGWALEIPKGFVGLLFPRSSVYKTKQMLSNSVGVIDSGYRGEIMFKFTRSTDDLEYYIGDRIGQILILPYPTVEFEQVEQLSETERGEGGYGSTGT